MSSAKQKKFAQLYTNGESKTQAARDAGYSEDYINRALSKIYKSEGVQSEIANINKKVRNTADEKKNIMSKREAYEHYTRIARGQETSKQFVGTGKSLRLVDVYPTIAERIAALREIVKLYPADDELHKAQIERIKADIELKREQTKNFQMQTHTMEQGSDVVAKRVANWSDQKIDKYLKVLGGDDDA